MPCRKEQAAAGYSRRTSSASGVNEPAAAGLYWRISSRCGFHFKNPAALLEFRETPPLETFAAPKGTSSNWLFQTNCQHVQSIAQLIQQYCCFFPGHISSRFSFYFGNPAELLVKPAEKPNDYHKTSSSSSKPAVFPAMSFYPGLYNSTRSVTQENLEHTFSLNAVIRLNPGICALVGGTGVSLILKRIGVLYLSHVLDIVRPFCDAS